jgi:hypothetical protein
MIIRALLFALLFGAAFAQDTTTTSTTSTAATTPTTDLTAELPDDAEFVRGSPEVSEDDMVAALEAMDGEMGRPEDNLTEEQVNALAAEVGHEMWVSDRDLYERVFSRYKTERMPLDEEQEYYHRILMSKIEGVRLSKKDELSNLFRFYIYLTSAHEGMSYAGARRYRASGQSYSGGVGHGGYIPGVLDQYRTQLADLVVTLGYTRYPTRQVPTGYVRTFIGIELWDITRTEPDPSQGYLPNVTYARQVSGFLRRYKCGNGLRGIRESDLMLVWLLANYRDDLFTDRVREWAQQAWPGDTPDAPVLAAEIYECKTTPSLAFNNEVARRIAEPISWEALGMPTTGIYNRLARFSYEHPVLTNLIPIYGACWRAANSLCDAYEGRDAEGNRLGAGGRALAAGSFLFNWAMAVSDVYLVKGIAQVTVRGAAAAGNAAGRLLPESARQTLSTGRAVVQRAYARVLQSTLRAVPQGGLNAARAVRGVIGRQLKIIRNYTVAPSAEIARTAKEAAQRTFREMRSTVMNAQKQVERVLRPGEEAYNLRSVTAVVDRTDPTKIYTGINANGAVRGAIQANGQTATHGRLAFIKRWIQRVTGRDTLKPWSFENCSEWEAINNALQDGRKMEDLVIYTTKNAGGVPFVCCLNCRFTTLGASVLSNNEAWIGQVLAGTSAVRNTATGVTSVTGGSGRRAD